MIRSLVLAGVVALAGLTGWLLHGWLVPSSLVGPESGVARVARGRLEQMVKARGIVKPAPTGLVRLGFPFPKDQARQIVRFPYAEGDIVEAGAELAQLDHDDLKATLAQLAAERQVFHRRLEALRVLEPVETRQAEAAVAERKALVEHAQRMHDRLARLVRGTAVSVEAGETAASDFAVARARHEQGEVALQQTRARFRNDINILEAQLKQAEAAIESVEVQIRWSTLRSPLSHAAEVFAIHQRQGELTSGQPGIPVLTLLDPDQLQVHLYVDETDFRSIRVEQPVSLRLESHPDEVVKGKIVRVLPQPILQENVVYYLAVVEVVPEQRKLLRAEMTVLGHVQAGVQESVLWLPVAAVFSGPQGWYVRRQGPAGPIEVPVKIGWKEQARVEIRHGLAEGDEVLVDP